MSDKDARSLRYSMTMRGRINPDDFRMIYHTTDDEGGFIGHAKDKPCKRCEVKPPECVTGCGERAFGSGSYPQMCERHGASWRALDHCTRCGVLLQSWQDALCVACE